MMEEATVEPMATEEQTTEIISVVDGLIVGVENVEYLLSLRSQEFEQEGGLDAQMTKYILLSPKSPTLNDGNYAEKAKGVHVDENAELVRETRKKIPMSPKSPTLNDSEHVEKAKSVHEAEDDHAGHTPTDGEKENKDIEKIFTVLFSQSNSLVEDPILKPFSPAGGAPKCSDIVADSFTQAFSPSQEVTPLIEEPTVESLPIEMVSIADGLIHVVKKSECVMSLASKKLEIETDLFPESRMSPKSRTLNDGDLVEKSKSVHEPECNPAEHKKIDEEMESKDIHKKFTAAVISPPNSHVETLVFDALSPEGGGPPSSDVTTDSLPTLFEQTVKRKATEVSQEKLNEVTDDEVRFLAAFPAKVKKNKVCSFPWDNFHMPRYSPYLPEQCNSPPKELLREREDPDAPLTKKKTHIPASETVTCPNEIRQEKARTVHCEPHPDVVSSRGLISSTASAFFQNSTSNSPRSIQNLIGPERSHYQQQQGANHVQPPNNRSLDGDGNRLMWGEPSEPLRVHPSAFHFSPAGPRVDRYGQPLGDGAQTTFISLRFYTKVVPNVSDNVITYTSTSPPVVRTEEDLSQMNRARALDHCYSAIPSNLQYQLSQDHSSPAPVSRPSCEHSLLKPVSSTCTVDNNNDREVSAQNNATPPDPVKEEEMDTSSQWRSPNPQNDGLNSNTDGGKCKIVRDRYDVSTLSTAADYHLNTDSNDAASRAVVVRNIQQQTTDALARAAEAMEAVGEQRQMEAQPQVRNSHRRGRGPRKQSKPFHFHYR